MAGRRQRARAAKAKRLKLEAFEAQETERKRQIAAYRTRDRYSEGFKSSVVAVAENVAKGGHSHLSSHKQASMAKLDRDVKRFSRARPVGETIGLSSYGTNGLKSMPAPARKLVLSNIEVAPLSEIKAAMEDQPRWKREPLETRDKRYRRELDK